MLSKKALFSGLIIDENDEYVAMKVVGDETFYVVNDAGFLRHIESEYVDRQVLKAMQNMIDGHEDLVAEGTMKMLGQDDIFTKAMIEQSLKNIDTQLDALFDQGIPEETRTYLGMMGFKIVIDYRGDIVRIDQPEVSDEEGE